jgi:hypothetical protein
MIRRDAKEHRAAVDNIVAIKHYGGGTTLLTVDLCGKNMSKIFKHRTGQGYVQLQCSTVNNLTVTCPPFQSSAV